MRPAQESRHLRDTVIRVPSALSVIARVGSVFTFQQQGVSPLVLAVYAVLQMGLLFLLTWMAGKSTLGSCSHK
jgi:hypothetical protein